MTNRKFQLGYTVVEIAVVLAASLMMASWLAVNFFEWKRNLNNQAAARDIKIIKESIIDYAADHSAGASELFNVTAAVTILHRLPSGRPYLPCPDTDGDGEENRTDTYVSGGTITLVNNGTTAGEGFLDTRGSGCAAEKGFVPWRTLGTPPSDPWGNRYTYRVDPTFADEALGFDQETESSDRQLKNELYVPVVTAPVVEIRTLLTLHLTERPSVTVYHLVDPDTGVTTVPPQFADSEIRSSLSLDGTVPITLREIFTTITVTVGGAPDIIGDAIRQNPVAANALNNRPGIICSAAPCSSATGEATIIIGDVAAADDTAVTRGGYDLDVPIHVVYAVDNIINGLPVVVLSHGANGHGAAPFDTNPLRCHTIPIRNIDEIQNALGTCPPATLPVVFGGVAPSYGFVARPRVSQRTAAANNTPITQEFDDIVGWMSADEVIEALRRRGTLPVDLLPPVGLENN